MFEPLPALVRLQRQAQGLTIDALSALAGVSRTRLIALEKGEDNISLELLVKIANALRMKEIRIGGLLVEGTTPDFNVMVAAAEAIAAARRIIDQAAGAGEELDRVEGPVSEFLSSVITEAEPLDAATRDAGGRMRARRRAR